MGASLASALGQMLLLELWEPVLAAQPYSLELWVSVWAEQSYSLVVGQEDWLAP